MYEGGEEIKDHAADEADILDPPAADEPVPAAAGTRSAPASATKIEEIIVEAQRSARDFVEQARQQSSMLVEEADRQAREERAEIIENSRRQVDELAETAGEMLRSLNDVTAQLDGIVESLQRSSDRLREHVDELLGDSGELEDESLEDDVDDDDGSDQAPPSGLRRFTRG